MQAHIWLQLTARASAPINWKACIHQPWNPCVTLCVTSKSSGSGCWKSGGSGCRFSQRRSATVSAILTSSLVMWKVPLQEQMVFFLLLLPPPWIKHLVMLWLLPKIDEAPSQPERLVICLGLPYICARHTDAHTMRLMWSGLRKSPCKYTVCANAAGKIALWNFLFPSSCLVMAPLIQRPLLLSHQADFLGTRSVPKGSRPQEKDEVTFPHNAVTKSACEIGEAHVGIVEGSILLVLHTFFLSKQESLAQ